MAALDRRGIIPLMVLAFWNFVYAAVASVIVIILIVVRLRQKRQAQAAPQRGVIGKAPVKGQPAVKAAQPGGRPAPRPGVPPKR